MFLSAIALVLGGVLCLIIGLIMSSSTLYLVAAIFSALAVVILWRFLAIAREQTFVSHPAPQVIPNWERPFDGREADGREVNEDNAEAPQPEVSIDGYEHLLAAEILPSLETLSVEELEAVVRRERVGLKRLGIISRAERLIEFTRGDHLDIRERERALEEAAVVRPPPTRKRTSKAPAGRDTPAPAPRKPRTRKPPEANKDMTL